ncbi:unnamed protein product [marine sediment metagenome]|uniref:Uncharacterized protein n=1 Tax=marine sediment metagenome TaxID=412755 RepID=X1L8N8_9ZZZZ
MFSLCLKTVKISIIMLNITYSYGCLSNIIKITTAVSDEIEAKDAYFVKIF